MKRETIEFDTSRFPLVVVRFLGAPDAQEFERYLDQQKALVTRREPSGIVFESSRDATLTPAQRKRSADWLGQHEAQVRRAQVGWAFAFESAVTRGILTAILWMRPLPIPHQVVATVAEGEAWVRAKLSGGDRVRPGAASG